MLLLLLGVLLPCGVQARFKCKTNHGALTIIGYTGCDNEVVIPGRIRGLPVRAVGDSAFRSCYRLTSVTIPDTVTAIGPGAFSHCTSLTNVTIPDSVTTIGSSAFACCYRLTRITIPESVTNIGPTAFHYCKNLADISIGNSLVRIGEGAFAGCSSLTTLFFKNTGCGLDELEFYPASTEPVDMLLDSRPDLLAEPIGHEYSPKESAPSLLPLPGYPAFDDPWFWGGMSGLDTFDPGGYHRHHIEAYRVCPFERMMRNHGGSCFPSGPGGGQKFSMPVRHFAPRGR